MVNDTTTGFLYDGVQAIAELKGSALDTVYHTGLEIDEVLARYGASGNKTLLTDALVNVIAQANEDQTIGNFYAYSPYGQVVAVGPDEGNPLQYTGRENDGTGLYYYRARYYDPILKRFITEDPIGMMGGANFYSYIRGNPVSLTDPFGLQSVYTDMRAGTTTFNPAPYPGTPITIPTSTSVARNAAPGANEGFSTPDVNWIPQGTYSRAYGPNGSYIDTGDPRGRDIHGGGSRLPDPFAPNQGWTPTLGCTRGQNADVRGLGEAIDEFKRANPGVPVPYYRY